MNGQRLSSISTMQFRIINWSSNIFLLFIISHKIKICPKNVQKRTLTDHARGTRFKRMELEFVQIVALFL